VHHWSAVFRARAIGDFYARYPRLRVVFCANRKIADACRSHCAAWTSRLRPPYPPSTRERVTILMCKFLYMPIDFHLKTVRPVTRLIPSSTFVSPTAGQTSLGANGPNCPSCRLEA
jgi:hypothetical protein